MSLTPKIVFHVNKSHYTDHQCEKIFFVAVFVNFLSNDFQSSRNLPLPGSQPRNKGEWVELTRDFTQSLGGFVRSSQSDVMSCPEPSLILHGREHENCKFNRL